MDPRPKSGGMSKSSVKAGKVCIVLPLCIFHFKNARLTAYISRYVTLSQVAQPMKFVNLPVQSLKNAQHFVFLGTNTLHEVDFS